MCDCGSGRGHVEFRAALRLLGEGRKDKPKKPLCPVLYHDEYEDCLDIADKKRFARNMRDGLRQHHRKDCPKNCALRVKVSIIDLGQSCVTAQWSGADDSETETEGRVYRITIDVWCEPHPPQ